MRTLEIERKVVYVMLLYWHQIAAVLANRKNPNLENWLGLSFIGKSQLKKGSPGYLLSP
jgi:hypothetical protein